MLIQLFADSISDLTQLKMAGAITGAASVLVLGALLPFAVSLVLDGLVVLATKRRFVGVGIGLAVAGAVLLLGLGLSASSSGVALTSSQDAIRLLLPITSALALLAFVSRQVSALLR